MKIRVHFDAFYLCPAVTKACESKGRRRTIAALMPGLICHQGMSVRMKRSRKHAKPHHAESAA